MKRRRDREQELQQEISAHLNMAAQDRAAAGQPLPDARLSARRDFGNPALVADVTRDQWGRNPFDGLSNDILHAFRALRHAPAFTAMALASLALGIGANTAVFSIVHHVLLKPLPYPHAGRVVLLSEISPEGSAMSLAWPNYKDWRDQTSSYDVFGGIVRHPATLTGVASPTQLVGRLASASMFDIFGAKPVLGRVYTAAEDRPNGPPVVVLSNAAWQQHFGADPTIVGRAIRLDNVSYTVLGVLSPDLKFYGGSDEFYLPLSNLENSRNAMDRGNHGGLTAFARLKPGVEPSAAEAEIKGIAANLARQYPNTNSGNGAQLRTLSDSVVGGVKTTIWVLFGAVAFVLLIACSNVANLLVARVGARRREITVRTALGAGRWRITRALLSESLVLAVIGGALGALLAWWGVAAIKPSLPGNYRIMKDAAVSLPVLGFTMLLSMTSALLFGLWPARHASNPRMQESLNSASRGSSAGAGAAIFRRTLLVIEVALAVVLAVGATLLIRSLRNAVSVDLGFRTDSMLTALVRLPYKEPQIPAFLERFRSAVDSIPGVTASTIAYCLPVDGSCWGSVFNIDNKTYADRSKLPSSQWNVVGDNYFQVMGIALKQGRTFLPSDPASKNHVVVINETAARLFFPGENPIGRRVKQGWPEWTTPWREIVGVVADVRQNGPTAEQRPEIFTPFGQMNPGAFWTIMRSAVPPDTLASALRSTVRGLDSDIPVQNIKTMELRVADSMSARRFTLTLVSIFSGIAVLLAAVGVFSVIAYVVSQRTREIGIRIALGARAAEIVRHVLSEGVRIATIGIAIGLLASAALMKYIQSMLFNVKPLDPVSFTTVAIGIAVVSLLACLAPSLRASRVDPVVALRSE